MEFVDRIEEQKRLQKALNGEKAAFVVVYGRRRLGKSTLIKKVLTPNDVYYVADQTERAHQISLLAKEVGMVMPDFDKVVYPDWEALLTAKARKLPFLKEQEIVPVLFLKQKPLRESDALVMTPQQIIDAIG